MKVEAGAVWGPRRGSTINIRELEDLPLLLLQRAYGSRALFDAA